MTKRTRCESCQSANAALLVTIGRSADGALWSSLCCGRCASVAVLKFTAPVLVEPASPALVNAAIADGRLSVLPEANALLASAVARA